MTNAYKILQHVITEKKESFSIKDNYDFLSQFSNWEGFNQNDELTSIDFKNDIIKHRMNHKNCKFTKEETKLLNIILSDIEKSKDGFVSYECY